jgi:hypothetical protein
MADVPDSKSGPRKGGVGSSPTFGTEFVYIFSTTRTPLCAAGDGVPSKMRSDLIDDSRQAKEVPDTCRPGVGITEEVTRKTYSVASIPGIWARSKPERTCRPWRVSAETGCFGIGRFWCFASADGIVVISVPESTRKRNGSEAPRLVLIATISLITKNWRV